MQVYLLTNTINGKYYVGKTVKPNLNDYLSQKRWAAEKGKHFCMPVIRAIAKYGFEHFHAEVLATCTDSSQLDDLERLWIIALDARNHEVGYNIQVGGGASRLGLKNSAEHNRRIADANTGKKRTKEQLYVRTEEHRRQLRERMLAGGGAKAGKMCGPGKTKSFKENFTLEQRQAWSKKVHAARWGV